MVLRARQGWAGQIANEESSESFTLLLYNHREVGIGSVQFLRTDPGCASAFTLIITSTYGVVLPEASTHMFSHQAPG